MPVLMKLQKKTLDIIPMVLCRGIEIQLKASGQCCGMYSVAFNIYNVPSVIILLKPVTDICKFSSFAKN